MIVDAVLCLCSYWFRSELYSLVQYSSMTSPHRAYSYHLKAGLWSTRKVCSQLKAIRHTDSVSEVVSIQQSTVGRRAFVQTGAVAVSLLLGTAPALADVTRQSLKKSYFRYVPRIKEAMTWYGSEFKEALSKEDAAVLGSFFEETFTTKVDNSKRPDSYKLKSSKIERDVLSPMRIWASTFSEKQNSSKSRAMSAEVDKLDRALQSIQQSLSRSDSSKLQSAFEDGQSAIVQYIAIANDGLTRELNKVITPF